MNPSGLGVRQKFPVNQLVFNIGGISLSEGRSGCPRAHFLPWSCIMKTILILILLSIVPAADASEALFGYMYTTDTTPAGRWEYEQHQTWRSGKARGTYEAIDLRNEFEYGVTDNFQAAFYVNSSYIHSKNQYDPDDVSNDLPDHNEFNVNGASVELLYRLLSPYKDGMGLALYLEPEISVRDHMTGEDNIERALETRIILQKNFMDDSLVIGTNFMVEPEWEKMDGMVKKELWAEWTAGASYRFAPNWFAGLEFRNHMEFIDMNLANQEHSAYFAGASIHYATETYWWTLTALPQIAGWPRRLGVGSDGREVADSSDHLGQHERYEVRLRLGIPIGGEHKHEHVE
jgi:hypothetical protein